MRRSSFFVSYFFLFLLFFFFVAASVELDAAGLEDPSLPLALSDLLFVIVA